MITLQTFVSNEQTLTDSILDEFKTWLILHSRKPGSVRRHLINLKYLFRKVHSFTQEGINLFFLELKEGGRKNTYLYTLIGTIRVFTSFLKETNRPHDSNLLTIPFPKREGFAKATMSDNEIEAFLLLPPPRGGKKESANWKVWQLFFSIMAYTGMRPGEIAHLKIEDVDFGRNVFVILSSKNGKPRLVPIPPNLFDKIQLHTTSLNGEYLFPSKRGGKCYGEDAVVNNVDWDYNFKTRVKRLNIIRPHLSVYSLRHSFITRMLEEDVNLFKVQKIVGHNDLRTTQHYTHLTTKDIQRAIRQLPLIRNKLDPTETFRQLKEILSSFNLDDDRFEYKITQTSRSIRFMVKIKPSGELRVEHEGETT